MSDLNVMVNELVASDWSGGFPGKGNEANVRIRRAWRIDERGKENEYWYIPKQGEWTEHGFSVDGIGHRQDECLEFGSKLDAARAAVALYMKEMAALLR